MNTAMASATGTPTTSAIERDDDSVLQDPEYTELPRKRHPVGLGEEVYDPGVMERRARVVDEIEQDGQNDGQAGRGHRRG